jgi:uncharacterized cupin superfamily protein
MVQQGHWHDQEDNFVFVLEGELVLIEDGGETMLLAVDAAVFSEGAGNGHHMINRSQRDALYLEIGSRQSGDVATCSDVDLLSSNADGRFLHKDGSPIAGGSAHPPAPRLFVSTMASIGTPQHSVGIGV